MPNILEDRIISKALATVRHARRHVPHYRRVLPASDPDGREGFATLPILDLSVLETGGPPAGDDLLAGPCSEGSVFWIPRRDGGDRYTVLSHNEVESLVDVEAGMLRSFGIRHEERVINLLAPRPMDRAADLMNRAIERVGGLLLAANGAPSAAVRSLIEAFGATSLVGEAGAVLALARDLTASGRKLQLQKVGLTGRPLTPAGAALVAAALGARPQALWVAAPDVGPLGYRCESCSPGVFHLLEDCHLVEIIDPATGVLLPPDTVGDLVVTHLNRRLLPIIRLRIGERGTIVGRSCACGRPDRLLEVLQPWDALAVPAGFPMVDALSIYEEIEQVRGVLAVESICQIGREWQVGVRLAEADQKAVICEELTTRLQARARLGTGASEAGTITAVATSGSRSEETEHP